MGTPEDIEAAPDAKSIVTAGGVEGVDSHAVGVVEDSPLNLTDEQVCALS